MEQRGVVRFFTLKGLKTRAIHTEHESVYGREALALLTVKKWRKRLYQERMDLFGDPGSGRPSTNDVAGAMFFMLEERPFSSCKVLCRHFRIGKAACLQILHDKLGLKNFHLRRVPIDQPEERKSVIFEAPSVRLIEQKRPAFNGLSIGMSRGFTYIFPVIQSV
jgi:hypothetical protein